MLGAFSFFGAWFSEKLHMSIHVVIPARYGSSRFPGKPLADIAGKPMILHVIDRANESGIADVIVATDDQRIFDVVKAAGASVVMTQADHESGTDRLAEVAIHQNWADDDIVVNLQGDEPLIPPQVIRQLVNLLEDNPAGQMATLMTPIHSVQDLLNPNIVKAVAGEQSQALYFSRAPIPYPRDHFVKTQDSMPNGNYYRHLGMYAYRVSALKAIPALPPTELEQLEKLEQLRPLANGIKILLGIVDQAPGHGVDTPDDLIRVNDIFRNSISQ